MFAHREVVSASTLLSPAEIVYSRNFRGLLHVMREVWTAGETADLDMKQDILTYTSQMRERLREVADRVCNNAEEAQAKYKQYYDRKCSERSLEQGYKILVLMPSSSHNMMAEGIHPYKVLRKVNEYNYKIPLPKHKTILHINMLKKYHKRSETVGAVLVAEADEPEDEVEFPITVKLEEQRKSCRWVSNWMINKRRS